MHNVISSVFSPRVSALAFALQLLALVGAANAQSPVVFMTANPGPSQLSNSRLYRFDNGVQTFSVTNAPAAAYVGTTTWNEQVLVAEPSDGLILRYSPEGTLLGTFGTPSIPSSFFPSFLESDENGNVYTTVAAGPPAFTSMGIRFNASGVQTGTFPATKGIDADASGNVYAIDGNLLKKYSPGGGLLNSTPLVGTTWDLAIDEAGSRLFISRSTSISIFDISGAAPVLSGSIAGPPLADLTGVHYAPETGNVLTTDFGGFSANARGLEFTTSGVLVDDYFPIGADYAWDITSLAVVPEAGSLTLLCIGIAGVIMSRRATRR